MNWIYTKDEKPLAYTRGNWEGKCSDQVLVEDKNGEKHLAVYCEGFLDGGNFEQWYKDDGYEIETEIVRYLEIPY